MNQQQFLAHVREAVRQTELPIPAGGRGVSDPTPAGARTEMVRDRNALVARFITELTAVSGRAERVAANALDARVVEIAREWNARSCAIAGALDERLTGGLEIATDAARADFGLSDVVCAVAETGTLVLTSAERHSRLATLLPPRHLAIVRAEQIVPNFFASVDLMKRKWGDTWPAAVTLVTGPSRTADIELSLTIGVHGPGQVVVLVVE